MYRSAYFFDAEAEKDKAKATSKECRWGSSLTLFRTIPHRRILNAGQKATRHELGDTLPRSYAGRRLLVKSVHLAVLRHAVVVAGDAKVLGRQITAQSPSHRILVSHRMTRRRVEFRRKQRLLGGDAVKVASAGRGLMSVHRAGHFV